MTSDPGVTRQNSDYATPIQEALDELHQMQEVPRIVTNPEALDALERDIRGRTDRLSSLLLGLHLQHSLDSEDLQTEQALLVSRWPKPLKNDGRVQVWVRTAAGDRVPVWGHLLPPQGSKTGRQALRRSLCWLGALRE